MPEILGAPPTCWAGWLSRPAGRKAGEALAPLGFGPRHYAVMTVLATTEGPSQRAVADTLGIDRATVVALTDDLEQRGLVRRDQSIRDWRVNTVLLTPEGQQALDHAHQLMDDCEHSFLAVLPARERVHLADILRQLLAGNLGLR